MKRLSYLNLKLSKTRTFLLVFSVLSCLLLLPGPVLSLPEVNTVASGEVTFTNPDASTLEITATDKSIINYNSFNLAQGESVIIRLPSSSSEILNRVLGQESIISGYINCNGIFFLVNERGISFGPTAVIDVASLIASTRDISDSDFLSDRYVFKHSSSLDDDPEFKDKLLLNQGSIQIQDAGFGVLIAGAVRNEGSIVCNLGTLALTGGDTVELGISSDKLISILVTEAVARTIYDRDNNPITDQLKNTGSIEARGGSVILKASSLTGIFEQAVNLDGIVRADTFQEQDGVVRIVSSGKVNIQGQVLTDKLIVGDPNEGIPSEVIIGSNVQATQLISVAAHKIDLVSLAALTQIYKPGSIFLDSFNFSSLLSIDDLVTLQGERIKVTYLKANNLSLSSDNSINANPAVIIPANQLSLFAKQFGTSSIPLNLLANQINLNRTQGDISILESLGIGTSILLRGPPDGFGAILYNQDSRLSLKAEDGDISFSLTSKDLYLPYLLEAPLGNVYINAPSGTIYSYNTIIANQEYGLIIFKAASLRLGGTYIAKYIDLDPVNIWIDTAINTTGALSFTATNDIYVNANIFTDSGTITFTADSDSDNVGSFIQAAGTEIKTTTSGDIIIYAASATVYKLTAAGGIKIVVIDSTTGRDIGMPGDISIKDTLTAVGDITIYTNQNLDIQANLSAGSAIYLHADHDADATGTLTFTNGLTFTAGAGWGHYIKAANSLTLNGSTLTAGGNSATLSGGAYLQITCTSDSSTLTVSGAVTETNSIELYSYGNLDIQANLDATESLYLYADYDADGTGTLSFTNGLTFTVGVAGYGHYIKAANSLTLNSSTLIAGGNSATVSGGISISITCTSDSSTLTISGAVTETGGITFSSYGNLDIQADLNATFDLYIFADSDADGTGTLSFTNGLTFTVGADRGHYIKAANSLTIDSVFLAAGGNLATLSGGKYLQITCTSDSSTLTVTGAVTETGDIKFYSYGNIDIQTDVNATYNLYIYADYDNNGTGTLSFTNGLTFTAGATYTHYIKATNSLTINGSTLTAGGNSATLAGGKHLEITCTSDSSTLTVSGAVTETGDIWFYSYGNLDLQADVNAGYNLYLYADFDADATGTLSFISPWTFTAGANYGHYIKAANSLTINGSTLISGGNSATLAGGKNIQITCTSNSATLTVTGAVTETEYIYLYSYGNLDIQADLNAGYSLYLYADYDNDATGTLSFTNVLTFTAGANYGHYIQAANSLTINGSTLISGGNSATLSGGKNLQITCTSDSSTLTITGAVTETGYIYFYSYGNLDIQANLSAGSNLYLYADYDSDGTGNFIHTAGTISTTAAYDVKITGHDVSLGSISANSGSNNILVTATGDITSNSASFTAANVVLKTTAGNIGTSATPIPIASGTYVEAEADNGSCFISHNSGNMIIRSSELSGSTLEAAIAITTAAYGGQSQYVGDNILYHTSSVLGLTTSGDFTISSGVSFSVGTTGSLTIAGSWTNLGSFTCASSTVTFSSTASGKTITANGSSFYNLVFNGINGIWTLQDDLTVTNDFTLTNGEVKLATHTLTIAGDFRIDDTFSADTGKVVFNDTSKVTHVYGTVFYDLEITTPGKEVQFEAGLTETITGTLTITGTADNMVKLLSTLSGTGWKINPQGTRNISYIDLKDCQNINANSISLAYGYYLDSGNNLNWVFVMLELTQDEIDTAVNNAPSNLFQPAIAYLSQEEDTNNEEESPLLILASPQASQESKSSEQVEDKDYIFIPEKDNRSVLSKNYKPGKYRTIVMVIEGKVVAAEYSQEGVKKETMAVLTAGENTTQKGVVEETGTKEESGQDKENKAKTSGIQEDYQFAAENNPAMLKKEYLPGTYKTIVIVLEGRVIASPYDEKGIARNQMQLLDAGENISHQGVVEGETRL